MINVYIKGHQFKHDLFELIRAFFPNRDINFVEDMDRISKYKILIESSLVSNFSGSCAITRIYNNGELIKENKEDIGKTYLGVYDEKQIIKNSIKRSIYDVLLELSHINLPWGILTGIRPVKIVHKLIDGNMPDEKISEVLEKEYRIHKPKGDLMMDVAKVQRDYLYPLDENRYSLYIGIPFCPTRCSYCSFPAFEIGRDYDIVKRYIDTLIYEINSVKKLMKGKRLNTVYIGGGTPTSIKVKDLERVIESIRINFSREDIGEFTVEAGRPDTLSRDMLKMIKEYDINRISINPQTMNDKTLKLIGRNHDSKSIISTYYLAKDIGFDIINMDIILGLPGEGIDEVKHTLNEMKKLNPENLTVHTLSLKRGSRLVKDQDAYLFEERVNVERMIEETQFFAKDVGFIPYYLYRQKQILGNLENVGYCKPDCESIYNILMMEEKETVIGVGLGAVSKIYHPSNDRIQRVPNFKDLIQYNNRIEELIEKKKNFIL